MAKETKSMVYLIVKTDDTNKLTILTTHLTMRFPHLRFFIVGNELKVDGVLNISWREEIEKYSEGLLAGWELAERRPKLLR